ncbi:hypothetical protein CCACVL1_08791 [Corchorus capsularis]|uniref:Uncharacterized protein n=1 Tax=Corchorus capsularis TaxID=210143 RepID=A0A1R3IYV0_COCAP|nr:hypothetical protein CCACVL1_08791 [Corchorus capsularis]
MGHRTADHCKHSSIHLLPPRSRL